MNHSASNNNNSDISNDDNNDCNNHDDSNDGNNNNDSSINSENSNLVPFSYNLFGSILYTSPDLLSQLITAEGILSESLRKFRLRGMTRDLYFKAALNNDNDKLVITHDRVK